MIDDDTVTSYNWNSIQETVHLMKSFNFRQKSQKLVKGNYIHRVQWKILHIIISVSSLYLAYVMKYKDEKNMACQVKM